MRRKQAVMLVVLALAAAAVIWLARSSRQPPVLPPDDIHAGWDGPAACLTCHGPDAAVPRSVKHPLGDDCIRCHGRR